MPYESPNKPCVPLFPGTYPVPPVPPRLCVNPAGVTESSTTSIDLAVTSTHYTVQPMETTPPGASQEATTQVLPETTGSGGGGAITTGAVPPTVSTKYPSLQQLPCTLAAAITSMESCPPAQPAIDTNSPLSDQVTSALLDDDIASCMNPFQSHSQLRLAVDAQDTQGASLLRIQVAGHGLDCVYPSTLVYVDIDSTQVQGTVAPKILKQECLYVSNSLEQELVTCTFECRPLLSCNGSARFGVQLERISWLTQSQSLDQLCDIRAFVWI